MESYSNRELSDKKGELSSSGAAVKQWIYIEDIPDHIMEISRASGDTRTKQELIDYVNAGLLESCIEIEAKRKLELQ